MQHLSEGMVKRGFVELDYALLLYCWLLCCNMLTTTFAGKFSNIIVRARKWRKLDGSETTRYR